MYWLLLVLIFVKNSATYPLLVMTVFLNLWSIFPGSLVEIWCWFALRALRNIMPGVSPWDVWGTPTRYYSITVQFLRVCRHANLFLVCQVSVKKRRNLLWNTNLSEPLFASVNTAPDNRLFYFSHYFEPCVTERVKQIKFSSKTGSV